jgi:hypothetical protein
MVANQKNNLKEDIHNIKRIMGLITESEEKTDFVKIYSDGQGSDNSEEYEGEIVKIPVEDLLRNEPFKDDEYMERSDSVRNIIKDLKKGDEIPPIKVIRHPYDSKKYLVIDGNHRSYVFEKLGKELINAVVIPYSDVVLVRGKYGSENQKLISMNDIKDDVEIIDKYFVRPDKSFKFKKELSVNEKIN